jgi:CRISPR/Cas system-associated exonuclease Cas4 (RecB family)
MLQTILDHFFSTDTETPTIMLEVSTHNKHPDHSKFRVSDAGKCHRMRYWKRQGKEGKQEFSLELNLALQTGNLLHAWLQFALQAEGVLIASEMELEDEHRIGHLDAIVNDVGNLILYDFKTVGGKQMYYLKQDARPKTEHVAQITTYLDMYLNNTTSTLDQCRIVYISRDTMELLDLEIPDQGYQVKKDWNTLIGYWERQETPPMTSNQWECKYCLYHADCAR